MTHRHQKTVLALATITSSEHNGIARRSGATVASTRQRMCDEDRKTYSPEYVIEPYS